MVKFSDKRQIRISHYTTTHITVGMCMEAVMPEGVWKSQ